MLNAVPGKYLFCVVNRFPIIHKHIVSIPMLIRNATTYRVEEGHADVLDHAVQRHELEDTEGGDKRPLCPPWRRGPGTRGQ